MLPGFVTAHFLISRCSLTTVIQKFEKADFLGSKLNHLTLLITVNIS